MTINVNLKPGAAKKSARKLPQVPSVGAFSERFKMPEFDKMMTFIIAAWIIGPALIGLMFFTQRAKQSELDTNIAAELADSTKYAQLIAANKTLLARRDTIAMKVNVIQEIDAGRYVWSHVMEEISRAIPQYIWLTTVEADLASPDPLQPGMKILGSAGNTLALTRFIQDLEASPFLRAVTLQTTTQIEREKRKYYTFELRATAEQPPAEAIRTAPLFAASDSLIGGD